jgi:serine/threonine-protein kinase
MSDLERPPVEPMPQPAGQPPSPPGRPPTLTGTLPPDEPNRPPLVGRYEILGTIARGWPATVYRARDPVLNRLVALKLLASGADASPENVERFRLEAEALARLGDHPHIVEIYEVGEHEGQPYFTMKLLEDSLDRHLAAGIPLPHEVPLLILRIAGAVQHVHQRGILHRDLKPANILLDTSGTPYLTGFWLNRSLIHTGPPLAGTIIGTPAYMAPEQARGEGGITPAVDVYGLGAILYACLTGRPPFTGPTVLETIKQVIESEPAPPRSIRPQANKDLAAVALKCLRKDPTQRYRSAEEVAAEVYRFLRGERVQARPRRTLPRVLEWIRGG